MKTIIGIDPGKHGAIAISAGNEVILHTIPLIGKIVDTNELLKIFDGIVNGYANSFVVIEDVHAIFGVAAKATFEFGYVCGLIEGVVVACNLPFFKVSPKVWQKEMWQGIPEIRKPGKGDKRGPIDTKEMSLCAVKRLFPKIKYTDPKMMRATKPHDGIVDALLISEYGVRKFRK